MHSVVSKTVTLKTRTDSGLGFLRRLKLNRERPRCRHYWSCELGTHKLSSVSGAYLGFFSQEVFIVGLQNSIPARIRQRILYNSNNKEEVDGFVWEMTLQNDFVNTVCEIRSRLVVGGGVRIHPENARMSGLHGVQYVTQCVEYAALTLVVRQ